MKEQAKSRTLVYGSIEDRIQTISQAKLNKATAILRDKLYKDKMKAAITEPLCNAIDEHRKNGVTRPVDVILTQEEIIIRDYGKGLDDETAFNVFFQYLESTKTDTDEQIGGFGLGAKAPGAYAQVYSVVSYYNGKKTIFWSRVDGDVNVVSKVASIDTDAPSGIAVHIPWAVSHTAESEIDAKTYVQREIWNAWKLLHDLYVFVGYGNKPEFRVISSITITEYEDRPYYYSSSATCKWKLESLYSNEAVEDVDTDELNDVTATDIEWHFHRLAFMSTSEDDFCEKADKWYPGERDSDMYTSYITYTGTNAFMFTGKRIKTFERSFMGFRYHMFTDRTGLYDGDMLYPVIENTANTRPLINLLVGYSAILKVDRSEICINQSRESASLTAENVDKLIEDIKHDVVHICDKFVTHTKNKLKSTGSPLNLHDVVNSSGALSSILSLSQLLTNKLGMKSKYYDFFKLMKSCTSNSCFLTKTKGAWDKYTEIKSIANVKSKATGQYSFALKTAYPCYEYISKTAVIRNPSDLVHAARFQDFLEEANALLGDDRYIIGEKALEDIISRHELFIAAEKLGYDLSITKYDEDLEELIDSYKNHKVVRKTKVKNEITELTDLMNNGGVISDKDYKKTLIVSASDFKSSNTIFGKWFKYSSKDFFDVMLRQLGYEHLATCKISDMKKFLEAGCTRYDKNMNPKILECISHMVHRMDLGFIKTIANRLGCEQGFTHALIPEDWVMSNSVHAEWILSFLCTDANEAKKLKEAMYSREKQLMKAQRDVIDHADEFYESLDENELYYINSTPAASPNVGKKSTVTYRKYEDKMKAAIKIKFEKFLSQFSIKSI